MEFTQETLDALRKLVLSQIKSPNYERVEDAIQDAIIKYLERVAAGEEIIEPLTYIALVAKRRYFKQLKRDRRQATFSDLGEKMFYLDTGNNHLENSFLGEQCRDVLLALSDGHPILDVAEAYGLTYYRVQKLREDWANS